MSTRIQKHVAMDLILYCKNLHVFASSKDKKCISALEFYRQMSSPKLKKQNPSFDCTFQFLKEISPAYLKAEFSDGTKWEINTGDYTCANLRSMFYERAMQAEEIAEELDDLKASKAPAAATPSKGGAKPGKK